MIEHKTYEEFLDYCKQHSDSINDEWNKELFKIVCQKCNSDKTGMIIQGKRIACGTSYTGCWTSKDSGILVKCSECGNAMILGEIKNE